MPLIKIAGMKKEDLIQVSSELKELCSKVSNIPSEYFKVIYDKFKVVEEGKIHKNKYVNIVVEMFKNNDQVYQDIVKEITKYLNLHSYNNITIYINELDNKRYFVNGELLKK